MAVIPVPEPWLIHFFQRHMADDLGGPSLICLDGLSKPVRSAASPRDYRRVRQYADEFRKHRTVYGHPDR